MTSNNSPLKASMGYTVGNILIKGITFITLPIFSRLLSTSEFGIYNTYIAYENILAIILGLGMYSSIKNAKFDFPNKVNIYVSTLLWITVIPLVACILLVNIFPDFFCNFTGLSRPLLIMLIFQSYGSAMLSVSNAKLSLNYEYKKYLGFASFNTIINVGLSIILITTVFSNQREYGRIIGSAVPLILIGIYVFVSNEYSARFRFDRDMSKYAMRIGFPLIWHYLSQQIQNQFDRIAITNIIGSSATGIYSFAYSIANILQVIFYSIENVWSVWFYEQMSKANYKKIRETSKKYMLLIASIAIIMMTFSKEVIMIMGDKEYWSGSTVFIPILIGIFLLYLYTVPVAIEYYYKETKFIAMMTAIAALINISTNYIFIPLYGYVAAAYTTMFSYLVQFLAHWFISKWILRKHGIDKVFYFKDLLAMFMLVCICGVAVYLLNDFPIVKYVLFGIAFSVLAYFERDDLKLLVSTVLKKQK